MAVQMSGRSLNFTSVELTHGPSGLKIKTTAPLDNGGDGTSFSPTDLCAASLGACATTIMMIYAQRQNIPLEIEFSVEKNMAAAPRRISKIALRYVLKTQCSEEDFQKIVNAGQTCPVRKTLGEHVEVDEHYRRG